MLKYAFLVAAALASAAGSVQAGGGTIDPDGQRSGKHADTPPVDLPADSIEGDLADLPDGLMVMKKSPSLFRNGR